MWRDAGLLVMARTDARSMHGVEAAIAPADLLLVEATETANEIRALPQRLRPPQRVNMVIGGKTPIFGADELGTLGYCIVRYANAALQGALAGMQRALTMLRDTHGLGEDPLLVAPFAKRQRLLGKPRLDRLEREDTATDRAG